jgi:membrane-associated phospholipid phosphatase
MHHSEEKKTADSQPNLNRRKFVGGLLGAGAAVGAAAAGKASAASADPAVGLGRTTGIGTLTPEERQASAFQIRENAALFHQSKALPVPVNNGDESIPGYIASFSKTLPHNNLGEVDQRAYTAYLNALASGRASDFEAIPMGGPGKLSNPQSSYTFSMEGPDSHQIGLDPPPSFSSAAIAGEMVEDYWLALTRDISFTDYGVAPLIQQAIADMNKLSVAPGPKTDQGITPDTIFRGPTAGDLTGPYISQFLWLPIPYGMTSVDQRYKTAAAGVDFMISPDEWLSIQRGNAPSKPVVFDATPRYIRNGRDMASYVHSDFSYQAVLNATLYLLSLGAPALSNGNPYKSYKTQSSFTTFGAPNALDMVARVSSAALKATWNQKWLIHRRIRPEAFAGRVHNQVTNAAQYPLHQDVLNSAALQVVYSRNGNYLLPLAYPEGSPTHPSYPAGHAALMGAGVTMLKAFFQESATIPNPMVASSDGLSLVPYTAGPLTIGGELNKLASNIALGRDTAGVHYRSDGMAGLALGEAVALGVLQDMAGCYTEDFNGFTITRFDGTVVSICAGCVL